MTVSRTEEQVRNEVEIMRRLNHIHVASVQFWLKSQTICSIFMWPSADYNLGVYLEDCCKDGCPDDNLKAIVPWFGCLLSALDFAHRLKIVHRDIKPSNILVKNQRVYLADFGEAKDNSLCATTSHALVFGTPVYRAPEILPGNPRGFPADIFSLGCVFSEMLTVYSQRTLTEYREWRQVADSEYPIAFRENMGMVKAWIRQLKCDEQIHDYLDFLLKRMLIESPENRSTASQLWDWLMKDKSGKKFYCDDH